MSKPWNKKRLHWIGVLPFSSSLDVEAPESLWNLQTMGLSSKQRQAILLETISSYQAIFLKTISPYQAAYYHY